MPVCWDETTQTIKYRPLPEADLLKKVNHLMAQFETYCHLHDIPQKEIAVQRVLMPLIFTRVDKREGYFAIYHNQTKINEIKQAALVVYWILKLRPFMYTGVSPALVKQFRRINEGFSMYYLFGVIKACAKTLNHDFKRPSDELVDELMYAFSYWDISKEAMIQIAETLGEALAGVRAQGLGVANA